jgi:hypothetical protein
MLKVLVLSISIVAFPKYQKIVSLENNKPSYEFKFANTSTYNPFKQKEKTKNFSPEELKKGNWYTNALHNIEQSEYHFNWDEKLGSYFTSNRKQNLRFFYNEDGFSVEPRTTKIPVENYEATILEQDKKYKYLPNWKIHFNLDKSQIGKGFWQTTENKAEYISEKIIVQYINNKEGMRQNFIVQSPLCNSAVLNINFNIKTKLKTYLNNNQLQFYHKKTKVLNYEDLKVWDANNKPLSASFIKNKNGIYSIQVNTKNATYPVTIDPLSTTPNIILESNQANANMGWSVSSAGDVNADGYSDVIIGAPSYDNGQVDEGVAFVYHGSSTGINPVASAILENNQINSQMGFSVSTAGDVNGDGYSDIIVGASLFDNVETDEGAAYIYHGSATGVSTTPNLIIESNQVAAQLGFSVSCAGDVDNDGYSDIILGAWLFDDGEANEGVAFVHHGSATGVNATPAIVLQANQSAANYGIAVASAGDVNGDGYSDVIVGAEDYDNGNTDEGVAFVYHGSATGLTNIAATTLESNQDLSQFGFAVSSAGDVNGDGYSDVIVGAYLFDNGEVNEGNAFVYHGSATGIVNTIVATLQSNQSSSNFGISVKCAGDINSDGYSDVLVGADMYQNGQSAEGGAFIYYGSSIGTNITPTILESNQANARMGRGINSCGDVNGDGYSDVIVGAWSYDNGQNDEGAAFVYHGSAAGISNIATSTLENNVAFANYGCSVASAGDVNGDGFSDVIIGSQYYSNGQINEGAAFVYLGTANGINSTFSTIIEGDQLFSELGNAVSTAGDVNADGYSDIIIGAHYYDNGEHVEGGALVFYGSSSGINSSFFDLLEANQADAFFGQSVASAGDVNGDGFGDVIVGAQLYDNPEIDEGAAFVFLGSATGINLLPSTTLQSNQASALFGYSVAGAGDVNGDGFSDVIVGAYNYTNGQANEGVAFTFLGSLSGINPTYATLLENNQTNAAYGYSVAGIGDVNGDGFSDIAIGSPKYSNSEIEEGVVFVYNGSITGINATPTFTLEGNQNFAELGNSVGNAGDVNGDGYSDVIIGIHNFDNGQIDEGVIQLFYGSNTGLSIANMSSFESNQASSNMGRSVNSAGDVNGDGYADILTGAPFYDNGESNEGVVFLLQGNPFINSFNKRNNLRLYNPDLITPLNNSNFIFGNFGAGLFAKSFLGRDKGKMVWETRLNYNPYSGTPITNSTFFTAQQVSYTDLGLNGVELKSLITKILGGRFTKLRARVKYNITTAITGQVYGPWRNVSSIIDANNIGVLPIDLISFTANWLQKGSKAKIDFITDKELGICCFEVQKSTDGFNFTTIANINARNTNTKQSYSFLDVKASSNKQFYRLKIKGTTGQTQYSNIQQLDSDMATEIVVFPNPTTNFISLQLNKNYSKVNVQIINALGQVVKQYNNPTIQNQLLKLSVNDLKTGVYWLSLYETDNGNKQTIQFFKQ